MNKYQTEFTIQNALYSYLADKGHEFIIPNIYLGYEESDLISVTKAGYINEYEIKISKSDFKADFKKHKHNALKSGRKQFRNYFWFVTTNNLISENEIPEYAGYITVSKAGTCFERKRAKRLHNIKINEYFKNKIYKGYMFRYWRVRKRIENEYKERRTT